MATAGSRVATKGKHRFIDKLHVSYVEREKRHWAALENFNSQRVAIAEKFYHDHDRMLEGGIWAAKPKAPIKTTTATDQAVPTDLSAEPQERHFTIRYGETGHSFETIVGPYLAGAKEVIVEDPRMRFVLCCPCSCPRSGFQVG